MFNTITITNTSNKSLSFESDPDGDYKNSVTIGREGSITKSYVSIRNDKQFIISLNHMVNNVLCSVTSDDPGYTSEQIMEVLNTGSIPKSTLSNLELYVSRANGSSSGDGTVNKPFDDLPAAYALIPYDLKHLVRIEFMDPGTYTCPDSVIHMAHSTGQLSFDGSNHFIQVSGTDTSYTVGTFTAGGPDGYEFGIISVPGESWTVNEFKGKFIKGLTGWTANRYVPIMSNTADTDCTLLEWSCNWTYFCYL
jgi:hypothetical protein